MTTRSHDYAARLIWDGNLGDGTASYTSYVRRYRARIGGKPDLPGSADPMFRGDADRHNPEDFFLTAIGACHMLFYLSLCARNGIRVLDYADDVRGTLVIRGDGGGSFATVTLHPTVTIDSEAQVALATQLHDLAHELCFIANSCAVPILHEATVIVRPSTP